MSENRKGRWTAAKIVIAFITMAVELFAGFVLSFGHQLTGCHPDCESWEHPFGISLAVILPVLTTVTAGLGVWLLKRDTKYYVVFTGVTIAIVLALVN